jgi:hypothetical protein
MLVVCSRKGRLTMRCGCCVAPDQIDVLARAGYDFCELPASAARPFDDDAAAQPALRQIAAAPLRPEAFNILVPAALPLVEPGADHAALGTTSKPRRPRR